MEARERRIVVTAVALAEQGGFEAVRLRDVAAQAGVALGTLYRHFRSKEDLLVAALRVEAEELARHLASHPPAGETGSRRIAAFFEEATRQLCRKPRLTRAVLKAASSGDPELAEKIRTFHGILDGMILSALHGKRYEEAGELAATREEHEVASILEKVWFAGLIGWMGGQGTVEDVVDQVHRTARYLLRGAGIES